MNLPRLTTRRLLALVALVGLALGLAAWMQRRSEQLQDPMGSDLVFGF
jgi:hypothetical protein